MRLSATLTAGIYLGALALCALPGQAQIVKMVDNSGRQFFVNAEPNSKLTARSRTTIFRPLESPFAGSARPYVSIDRDGAEKLVREAADLHRVDPALVRAVIQTESNWNPGAISRKGAAGLMQLIPTTAQRFGASDALNPQQNVDAGVRYLKTLLDRYNGNRDLALAAYNAGEGAVDRAHGVPAYRETVDYIRKVQDAYSRAGSGRQAGAWISPRAIHKTVQASGRVVFTNE